MKTLPFVILALASPLAACGGSVTDPPGAGGGAGSTAQTSSGSVGGASQGSSGSGVTGTSSSGTTGSGTSVTGAGGMGTGGTGAGGAGAGGTGAGGTGQGGAGGTRGCGARLGNTCSPDEYCDFPDDQCGAADGPGLCRARPQACDLVLSPVCGCDGMMHSNDCAARAAGTDVSAFGCAPPAGSFACGPGYCQQKTEYCQRTRSDVGGEPDSYVCRPIPPRCSASPPGVICSCIVATLQFGLCGADAAGNITVTLPGG